MSPWWLIDPGAVLRGAVKVADIAGMCRGCHIRKPDTYRPCDSCGTLLCSKCVADMHKRRLHMIELVGRANMGDKIDLLWCEACNGVWGHT